MDHIMLLVPSLCFTTAAVIAAVIIAVYNIRTFTLSRRVQRLSRERGIEWKLYGDVRHMVQFVYMPTDIYAESDTPEIAAAKAELIRHRMRMWWFLLPCVVVVFLAFLFSWAIPLFWALLHQG